MTPLNEQPINESRERDFPTEAALSLAQSYPALGRLVNEVAASPTLTEEGKRVLVHGIGNYEEGIANGLLTPNARTLEQKRQRLEVFMGLDLLDPEQTQIIRAFINRWYSDKPEDRDFAQSNRDSGLGKIARLEMQTANLLRQKTELNTTLGNKSYSTKNIAGVVVSALETQ